MIQVDKTAYPCPANLKKKGEQEKQKNIAIIEVDINGVLDFRAYKGSSVLPALQKLFHKKCAYCESIFGAVTPADIEHFRPKGKSFPKGVAKSGFIGYYWLAADWENLLLSCPGCNRSNTWETVNGVKPVTLGKHEQFPLEGGEIYRCLRHGDDAAMQTEEQYRLLIHPCKENPEKFFEFIDNYSGADDGAIKVKAGLSDFDTRKAQESIRVFALHRADLAKDRARHLDRLRSLTTTISYALTNYNTAAIAAEQKRHEEVIKNTVNQLLDLLKDGNPFIAMSKQVVAKCLGTLSADIKAMIGLP
jgi:uncharacterized protein (TIGR02646 family)